MPFARFMYVLTAVILLSLAAGCDAPEQTAQTSSPDRSDVSQLRLVSLSPPITETLHYLGAAGMLVGRSDYCDYPHSVSSLPTAGTALSPDFERLALMTPDLILSQQSNTSYGDELERIAPTQSLAWLTLNDFRESIATLASLTHQSERGASLIGELDLAFATPSTGVSHSAIVILDNLFDGSTLWAIRPDSIHGAVMRAVGLENVLSDLDGKQPSISLEGLLELNPELIIVLTGDTSEAHVEAIRQGLQKLTPLDAVRTGRFAVIADERVFATGPSVIGLISRFRETVAELSSMEMNNS